MKKILLLSFALFVATSTYANPGGQPVHLTIDTTHHTGNGNNTRSPIAVPVLYIDGYTLTTGDYTSGSTINLLDEEDNVVFSTNVVIEGDIQLPTTLSGTYTIEVIRGDFTFIGKIEL